MNPDISPCCAEQNFDLPAQRIVSAAGFSQKVFPPFRVALKSRVVDLLDPLPAFIGHHRAPRLSSFSSQALA